MGTDKRLDPRVLRTRKLLRDALIDLLQTNSFDSITVQDITSQATLNRATFYLHYTDKHELLLSVMQDTLDELRLLPVPIAPDNPYAAEPERLYTFFLHVFQHVAQHAAFYRVMLREDSLASFAMRIQDYVEDIGIKWLERAGKINTPAEVVMSAVAGAYMGMIRWWLRTDMSASPNQVAEHFMQLVLPGVMLATGIPQPKSGGNP